MPAIQRIVPDEARRQYLDAARAVYRAIPAGTPHPIVMNVGLTLLETVLRECRPDGRHLVLASIRATIDLLEREHPPQAH